MKVTNFIKCGFEIVLSLDDAIAPLLFETLILAVSGVVTSSIISLLTSNYFPEEVQTSKVYTELPLKICNLFVERDSIHFNTKHVQINRQDKIMITIIYTSPLIQLLRYQMYLVQNNILKVSYISWCHLYSRYTSIKSHEYHFIRTYDKKKPVRRLRYQRVSYTTYQFVAGQVSHICSSSKRCSVNFCQPGI